MRTPESLRVAAVLALAAAGCQSAVNPDKIAPVLASTVCSSIYNKVLTRSTGCFRSPRAWIVATSAAPDCAGFDVSADAGRIQVDTGKLDTCLNDIGAATCDQLFGTGGGLPGACPQIILPQVPFGATCYMDAECTTGTYCADFLACPGTCKRYLGQGATCGTLTAPCDPSLVCRTTGLAGATTTSCEPYLPTGAECTTAKQGCGAGLYCNFNTVAVPQYTCQPQVAQGANCQGSEACPAPFLCVSAATGAPTTCEYPKAAGASCTVGLNQCAYGTFCAGTAAGATGTCNIYPSPPSTAGTCGLLSTGERVDCIGGYCNATACAAYIAPGQACSTTFSPDPSVQCGRVQNGYYCAGTSPNPGACASFICREP